MVKMVQIDISRYMEEDTSSKLTIRISADLRDDARLLAELKGTTVSDMVRDYLRAQIADNADALAKLRELRSI